MATDHKSSNSVSELPLGSAIENELPTYRAISPWAVLSLLCGVMSLFSFAHPVFYLFAILAIVLGLRPIGASSVIPTCSRGGRWPRPGRRWA